MRVTLIHNPDAGHGGDAITGDQLIRLIRNRGYEPVYQSTKDKDFPSALDKQTGLVVAAGGDGTVTRVAHGLDARQSMAILPLGTANNIANSLGVSGSLDDMISQWSKLPIRRLDLWTADTGDQHYPILEGCGLGIICNTAAELHRLGDTEPIDPARKLAMARGRLRAMAQHQAPVHVQLSCDGLQVEGDYLLLEALNLRLVGPRLALLETADCSDGLLEVVYLRPDQREAFCEWLDC